jgi:hypothetical protein
LNDLVGKAKEAIDAARALDDVGERADAVLAAIGEKDRAAGTDLGDLLQKGMMTLESLRSRTPSS